MPVGSTIGSGQINNVLTSVAVNMRNLMQEVVNLDRAVNGQGTGLAYLESTGFGSDSNPDNPGSESDAQYAIDLIAHMAAFAAIYFGQNTQLADFNYDLTFAPLWAGQVT